MPAHHDAGVNIGAVQRGAPRWQPDHAPGHGPDPLRPTTRALAQRGAPRSAGRLERQAGVTRVVFDGVPTATLAARAVDHSERVVAWSAAPLTNQPDRLPVRPPSRDCP